MPDCSISFVFFLKILCIMKIESGKGKRVRKTLKTWGSHFYTIHTDISLGQKDWVKNGKNGMLYCTCVGWLQLRDFTSKSPC